MLARACSTTTDKIFAKATPFCKSALRFWQVALRFWQVALRFWQVALSFREVGLSKQRWLAVLLIVFGQTKKAGKFHERISLL